MPAQDIKPVAAITGTYAVLKSAPSQEGQDGNIRLESGNNVPEIETAQLEKLAGLTNLVSQSIGRDLRIQVDVENGSSVILVLDSETGEIIRQIPPEKAKTYVSDRGDIVLRLLDDRA